MATTYESTFEITSWEETDLVEGDVRVYRTDVEKRFSGDIEGTSEAWLVMTITPSGPAAYVGLEGRRLRVRNRRARRPRGEGTYRAPRRRFALVDSDRGVGGKRVK